MVKDTYKLRLTDFKPVFGWSEYRNRNSHLQNGNVSPEFDEFRSKYLFLMMYNSALSIGIGFTIAKGLEAFFK